MFSAAASCGTAAISTCTPTRCPNGCCLANKCIDSPNNAKVASCGSKGNACVNCGARACVDFACSGGTGGGTSGNCGPGNCNGCCTGTTAASVCVSSPSSTNCGSNGSLCTSCGSNQACVAGACAYSDAGTGKVGTPCATNDDCLELGTNHVCKKTFNGGPTEYKDGYCTRTCAADKDCPSSALCLGPQPGYGENDSVCWARCSSVAECRSGYDCYAVGSGEGACWVAPLPAFDAGVPADKVGQACGLDSTCQNPPDDGVCLTDTLSDGGPSAFVGGYCSAPCDDGNHCSVDGGALCVSLGTIGACAQTCGAPMQGQGGCRSSYVCRSIRSGPDGGNLPIGFCWPSCQVAGCSVGTCQSSGYCQ